MQKISASPPAFSKERRQSSAPEKAVNTGIIILGVATLFEQIRLSAFSIEKGKRSTEEVVQDLIKELNASMDEKKA